jgi:N-acyl-D-amino-acid deacylase
VTRVAVLLAALACASLQAQAPSPGAFDILITNARVLDGSGNPWMAGDVGIRGDRIAAVGRLSGSTAARVIDAGGLILAPGFIDVHSHAAEGLGGPLHTAHALLAQGITTVFINPDGGGPTDLAAQRTALVARGIGVNFGQFVPHGSIRRAVLGMADRAPRQDEVSRMEGMTRDGMQAGGIGLSTGLYYAPASYATTDEVIALAKVAAETGGVYSSHIRDEADYSIGLAAAVDEVIRIAEEARIVGVVSHMKALGPAQWGLSSLLTARIDQARQRGVQVFADQYPYDASGTSLMAALVPRWAEAGGRDEFLKRLTGAERARLRQEIAQNVTRRGGPSTLVVASYEPDKTLEGRSLADIATARGVSAVDLVASLLEHSDGGLVSFNMSEGDIAHIMRQPWTMTCTDGDLSAPGAGKPHPRGYGAFARKLGVYVRQRRVLDLAAAVRSMTSLPAQVFVLADRGSVRAGAMADLVVFDPEKIADKATYDSPQQLAEGMAYVLVNGTLAIDDGRFTNATAGRAVR